MALLSDKTVLDAVERLAKRDGDDRHRPVPLKAIPTALDPPKGPDDPEVHLIIRNLLERGQLEVSGPGRVALTSDAL